MEEALIDVVQKGRWETLLARNVDNLAESDLFIDALAERMVGSNDLIKLVEPFLKHHIEKSNVECSLERMLERQAINGRLVQRKRW